MSVPLGYNINFRMCMDNLYYILAVSTMGPFLLKPKTLHGLCPWYESQNFHLKEVHLMLSRVKQITSPGWMHETSARTWCTGKTQRDRVEREVGGGIGMGNTCKPMAVSFQCMTKSTTIKRKNKRSSPGLSPVGCRD